MGRLLKIKDWLGGILEDEKANKTDLLLTNVRILCKHLRDYVDSITKRIGHTRQKIASFQETGNKLKAQVELQKLGITQRWRRFIESFLKNLERHEIRLENATTRITTRKAAHLIIITLQDLDGISSEIGLSLDVQELFTGDVIDDSNGPGSYYGDLDDDFSV